MFSLGGTIAMAGHHDGGVVTRLTGHDLLAGVGPLERGLDVQVHDLGARPSADLTFDAVLDAVDAAGQAVTGGARGIVLTQGTDTLEETAFLVDAVWPHDAPFVLTGAMRNPTLPGADGPANLSAALRVAASEAARDRGALVVLDNQIHAAAHVRKSHSTSLAAFTSPDLGPVGRVVEDVPRFLADVPRRPTVTGFSRGRLAATGPAGTGHDRIQPSVSVLARERAYSARFPGLSCRTRNRRRRARGPRRRRRAAAAGPGPCRGAGTRR